MLKSTAGIIVIPISDQDARKSWLDANDNVVDVLDFGTVQQESAQAGRTYKLRNNIRHPMNVQLNIMAPLLYITTNFPRNVQVSRSNIYADDGRAHNRDECSGISGVFRLPSKATIPIEFEFSMKDPMMKGSADIEITLDEVFYLTEKIFLPSGEFVRENNQRENQGSRPIRPSRRYMRDDEASVSTRTYAVETNPAEEER